MNLLILSTVWIFATALATESHENLANLTKLSSNVSDENKEEIKILRHLLNGYQTILYRYEENPTHGEKFENWNYNTLSHLGPPDRHRSKYTTEKAIEQLHNVDEIFPYYENYFNVTTSENSSNVRQVITERVDNIEKMLKMLGNGSAKIRFDFNVISLILLISICWTSLKAFLVF